MTPRPRIDLMQYHGVLPFDFAQGSPSAVEGWGPGRHGPSMKLRTIPNHFKGWRSLAAEFGNTTDRAEASPTDASAAGEPFDSGEVGAPAQSCSTGASAGSETVSYVDLAGRTSLVRPIVEDRMVMVGRYSPAPRSTTTRRNQPAGLAARPYLKSSGAMSASE
jgi:hypothetical protein